MKKTVFPLALSALACAAQAATVTVNDTTDGSLDNVCTLRDAVASITNSSDQGGCVADIATDNYGSNDTIEFDSSLAGASIGVSGTGGQIGISKNLIIKGLLDDSGKPNITLDANPGASDPGSNRIFNVTGGTSLSITGVRFIRGNAGDGNSTDSGGAIQVNVDDFALTLEQCEFDSNRAYWGGAVYVASASTATISNSMFSGNSASWGGGAVYVASASTATISNSTFSGNSTDNGGGGAVFANSTATISNSTFSGNSANNGGGGAVYAASLEARHLTMLNNTGNSIYGQALYISGSSATLYNSIVIGNNSNVQCASSGSAFNNSSYNLEGWAESGGWQASANTCGASNPITASNGTPLSDIINPTLADNGGPTPTLALSAGSPAIGAADPAGGTSQMWDFNTNAWADATLDQRGYGRATNPGNRSIGAYERGGTPPPSPPSGSGTSIPALPVPLLPLLAALMGTAAFVRQRRR